MIAHEASTTTDSAQEPKGDSPSITAIVLTYNESEHIGRCLQNIAPLSRRIVVVDSFSTDDTVSIAHSHGAETRQRRFTNQAEQFQWALDSCGIQTDWVLRVDADEYFEPGALAEIAERLPSLPNDVTGIEFKRKFIFKGRWLRHGGYYPTILLRLWRTGAARIEQRWMDEHAILLRGRRERFERGDLVDENLKGIAEWVTKHNAYATRHVIDFMNLEYGLFAADLDAAEGAGAQQKARRRLKNRVFRRLPLHWRSVLYFLYVYFVRLGFLDGRQGFIYHVMHALWYRVLIDTKLDEARAFIRKHGRDAFMDRLVAPDDALSK